MIERRSPRGIIPATLVGPKPILIATQPVGARCASCGCVLSRYRGAFEQDCLPCQQRRREEDA